MANWTDTLSPQERDRLSKVLHIPDHRHGACCEEAVAFLCVCRGAWDCPTHGVTHIGSHD